MDSNNFQSGSIISQTVALVSPRVETAHGVDTSQQCPIDDNDALNNDAEVSVKPFELHLMLVTTRFYSSQKCR